MDCHPNTHPDTSGQCWTELARGGRCKTNAVAWQLFPSSEGPYWMETCKRHQKPEDKVLRTYTYAQCWDEVKDAVFAKIAADHAEPVTEPLRQLPARAAKTDDEISAWLDGKTGLNGTMRGQWGHTCGHCDGQMDAAATGRPKQFCSTRCRVAAHRAAKKASA